MGETVETSSHPQPAGTPSSEIRAVSGVWEARLAKARHLAFAPKLWPVIRLGIVPAMEHADAFVGREYDTVIDVGANKGQFAAFAAWRWPKARIVCYEPLETASGQLGKVLDIAAPGRSSIRNCALGAEVGEFDMHVASREDSSSLLGLSDTQCELFDMEETGTVKVHVARFADEHGLDDLGRALLKIDVQGAEYDVLQGAREKLPAFEAVYVEASFVELYKGQRLIGEVAALLSEVGFQETLRFSNDYNTGEPVQADLLFERAKS